MHAFIYFKVLKESLRLALPVVAIQRNNTEDLIVNGVKIPAGSNIEVLIQLIMHEREARMCTWIRQRSLTFKINPLLSIPILQKDHFSLVLC